MADFDAIIIGAGIVGSAAAYYAAKSGAKVLLVEKHHFLHRMGSSHGESRIIRHTYPSKMYTGLMRDAYALWAEAEAESGMHVFSKCGGLDIIRSDLSVCTALLDAAAAYDVPTTTLSPCEVLERFGLVVPSTHVGVFQADTGILHATTAVSMFQGLAAKHGAVLRDRTRIAGISKTEGGGVELRTDGGEVLHGKRVLLACGAWAGPMLASLFGLRVDLQVWQCTVMYWQAKAAGESAAAAAANAAQLAALPVVIDYGTSSVWTSTAAPGAHTTSGAVEAGAGGAASAADGAEAGHGAGATPLPAPAEPLIYSCPSRELPGLIKFGVHQGVDVTADTRTFTPHNALTVAPVRAWLATHAPFIESEKPVSAETCLYTMTRDEDFIIDAVPGWPDVTIAAGFSGHGFKFGSVLGRLLADLVTTGSTAYDLTAFSIHRPAVGLTTVEGSIATAAKAPAVAEVA